MNKFHYNSNFKKNQVKRNVNKSKSNSKSNRKEILDELFTKGKTIDIYETRTYNFDEKKTTPRLKDVGHRLKKSVSLGRVKAIKTQYFYACQDVIDKLNTSRKNKKKRIISRSVKATVSLLLVVLIVAITIISQLKSITVIVNGKESKVRTNQYFTSIYAGKLADKYNFEKFEYECSTGNKIENGTIFEISNLKKVTTNVKGKEMVDETYTNTLSEYLDERQDDLKQYNGKYTYFAKEYEDKEDVTYMSDVKDIELFLKSTKTVDKTITSKFKTKYVENDKLESGKVKVKQKGVDGKLIREYQTIYLNDKEYKTIAKTKKVVSHKKDKIVERGTKVVSTSSSVWDRLAKCETGGRWHANTGNGFYGGLQFSAPTWRTAASKVGVSAPYAHLASKADQIKAAVWLQKNSGWGQWPACSSKLGLR